MSTIKDLSLVDILDDTLMDQEKSGINSQVRYPLRPSSAGKCSRALFYDLANFEGKLTVEGEVKSPSVIRLLALGHSVEYSLINQFRKLKKSVDIDTKYLQQVVDIFQLDNGKLVEGSVDFALEGNGFKVLADSKSAKDGFSRAFSTRWDENINKWSKMDSLVEISPTCFYAEDAYKLVEEFNDDFKINNICQLNLYLGSDFFQRRGYELGSLFYYIKNDSRLFELRFSYSEKLFDYIKHKYNKILKADKFDDVPKDYVLGSIRCAFCAYKDICWKDDDPKLEYFKRFPKKTFPTNLDEKDYSELLELFQEYKFFLDNEKNKRIIEDKIIKILVDNSLRKVRLPDGDIFEVKYLKSPRPHFDLRRSK